MRSIDPSSSGRDVVVVDIATSVTHAARIMSEKQIGAVPVVDGERVAGIFTERDVMARVVAVGVNPAETPVSAVMSTSLVVADVRTPTTSACGACSRRACATCWCSTTGAWPACCR